MNLIDYLDARMSTARSLSRAEAALLKIGYPLKTGWVKRHENLRIDDALHEKLISALGACRARQAANAKKKGQTQHVATPPVQDEHSMEAEAAQHMGEISATGKGAYRPVSNDFEDCGMRTWLNVPFAEKDQAKALGARWSPGHKRWYVEDVANVERVSKLTRWMPDHLTRPTTTRTTTTGRVLKLVKHHQAAA